MSVVVASGSALSVGANAKSAELISGQYEFTGPGIYTLIAKISAAGLNISNSVGGVALVDDQPVPFTGTAGTLAVNENVIASQALAGGRNSLTFRNTSGGALTADYQVLFDPSA